MPRDFRLKVFFMISFPQAPEDIIQAVSDFLENSRRYSQLKVHHRSPVSFLCAKMKENYFVECFCDCFSAINYVKCNVIDTCGKWKKISVRKVSTNFLGHLRLVVLTYRWIFSFKFPLRCHQSDIVSIICRRYRWHQWQICQRYQQHQRYRGKNLLPVTLIPVMHLYLRISPWIFEKIQNDPNVIFGGLGEHGSWKKLKKNLVTLSL